MIKILKARRGIARLTMVAIIVVVLVVAGIGAGAWYYLQPKEETGDIVIGVHGPMSGAAAAFGAIIKRGAEMARDEINAAGGVNGRQIRLVMGDDEGKPDVGVTVIERFITKDNVDAIMGGALSGCALAEMETVAQYDIPYWLCITGSMDIPQKIEENPEKYWMVFMCAMANDGQTISQANFLEWLVEESGKFTPRSNTYALVVEESDWGRYYLDSFPNEIGSRLPGWTCVKEEIAGYAQADYYTLLNELKILNPDVIISAQVSVQAMVALTKQFHELGLTSLLTFTDGGLVGGTQYQEILGPEQSDTILYLGQYFEYGCRAEIDEFWDAYVERYGLNPGFGAGLEYEMVHDYARVVEKIGTTDGRKVCEAVFEPWFPREHMFGWTFEFREDNHNLRIFDEGYMVMPEQQVQWDPDGETFSSKIIYPTYLEGVQPYTPQPWYEEG